MATVFKSLHERKRMRVGVRRHGPIPSSGTKESQVAAVTMVMTADDLQSVHLCARHGADILMIT